MALKWKDAKKNQKFICKSNLGHKIYKHTCSDCDGSPIFMVVIPRHLHDFNLAAPTIEEAKEFAEHFVEPIFKGAETLTSKELSSLWLLVTDTIFEDSGFGSDEERRLCYAVIDRLVKNFRFSGPALEIISKLHTENAKGSQDIDTGLAFGKQMLKESRQRGARKAMFTRKKAEIVDQLMKFAQEDIDKKE